MSDITVPKHVYPLAPSAPKREGVGLREQPTIGAVRAELVSTPTVVTVRVVVKAKSPSVGHVLAFSEGGHPYAVTPKAAGADWSKLKPGLTLEVRVTDEPLPQVISARIVHGE